MHAPEHAREVDDGGEPTVSERLPESVRRLACYRVDHDTRPVDELGAVTPADSVAFARRLIDHDRVTEAVVLDTCNRVEVYLSTRTAADHDHVLGVVDDRMGEPDDARVETGQDAVRHLMRVACGLESRVVGEDHILGQVRRTFQAGADDGLAGGVVTRLADAAIAVGRTCREETAINEGSAGYGSVTCDVIAERASPERLVVVGAGDIASSVVHVASHRLDAQVDVVNRSPATDLPTDGGRYYPLEELHAALDDADAVVTATGATEPVVTADALDVLGSGVPVVDLGTPPNVAEPLREARSVTPLSAVQERMERAVAVRRQAVPTVEERLVDAVERFVARERENAAEDTLRQLHRRAAEVRDAELQRARSRLEHGDADPETVLEEFASALTGSLLGTPTDRLRTAARNGDDAVIDAAHRLFDLEESD